MTNACCWRFDSARGF